MKNKSEFLPVPKYKKLSIPEILESINGIDIEKIAEEILNWTTNNVEYFIDNQRKIFKLDLVVDSEHMSETQKLQDLYRAIPDDDTIMPSNSKKDFKKLLNTKKVQKGFQEIQDCRSELDKVTSQIHEIMTGKKEILEKLFTRMIFFYEMVGISDGRPLIREMSGGVQILKFEYEAFPVGVKITNSDVNVKGLDGQIKTVEGIKSEYVIPEGFTLWIEIAYKPKVANTGLF